MGTVFKTLYPKVAENEIEKVSKKDTFPTIRYTWRMFLDPSLNGNLHYPINIDRSLNEPTDDKIRKYRADYNNNPPDTVSFMSPIPSTSGRLHSEFVRLLFLQDHRETDRFSAASGVQFPQHDRDQLHFHRSAFVSHLKTGLV